MLKLKAATHGLEGLKNL